MENIKTKQTNLSIKVIAFITLFAVLIAFSVPPVLGVKGSTVNAATSFPNAAVKKCINVSSTSAYNNIINNAAISDPKLSSALTDFHMIYPSKSDGISYETYFLYDVGPKYDNVVKLVNGLTAGKTKQMDKFLACVKWLCDNVSYTTGSQRSVTGIDLFTKKKGACMEISLALELMCRIAGMPAYIIKSTKAGNHQWNRIRIDGTWYFIDLTGAVSLNDYKNFETLCVPVPPEYQDLVDAGYPEYQRPIPYSLEIGTQYLTNSKTIQEAVYNEAVKPKAGWNSDSKGNYYYLDKNFKKVTGWLKLSGKYYYLNKSTGFRKSGWMTLSGKKYHFSSGGVMSTKWKTISGKKYYFGTNGVMVKKWKKIGKAKYYFGTNGVMVKKWKKISGKQYYFGTNGKMVTGKKKIGKKKYTFKKNGVLKGKK